ncbi:MAG: hypothetical protein WBS24_13470 [Terriglobales bacterium]
MTGLQQASQNSAEERASVWQALQPIYAALVREFVLDVDECPFEPASTAKATVEVGTEAEAWFSQVDSKIQVHQLRQFLQTTPLANEAALRNLIFHHLQKSSKSSVDRDKIDFLIVQYFSLCEPAGAEEAGLSLEFIGQVLEPVLGKQTVELPAWLAPLDSLTQTASRSRRLSELLHGGTLEQGRRLKMQAGERFYEPAAMIAFARFSFMLRRIFFRLMQDDLNAIQSGLRELEKRGVSTIDCRRAQFSAEESIGRLRLICRSWKVMFHAEYSSGQPLRMLVDLRAAVDDALGGSQQVGESSLAASASAGGSQASPEGNQ